MVLYENGELSIWLKKISRKSVEMGKLVGNQQGNSWESVEMTQFLCKYFDFALFQLISIPLGDRNQLEKKQNSNICTETARRPPIFHFSFKQCLNRVHKLITLGQPTRSAPLGTDWAPFLSRCQCRPRLQKPLDVLPSPFALKLQGFTKPTKSNRFLIS